MCLIFIGGGIVQGRSTGKDHLKLAGGKGEQKLAHRDSFHISTEGEESDLRHKIVILRRLISFEAKNINKEYIRIV